jgi:protein O-mannosyl-transferase
LNRHEVYKADKYRSIIICLCLSVCVLIVFWNVQNHDFVHYDDQAFVIENSYVHSGLTSKSISWAFTTGHTGCWHPLTWLSLMLDYELFKLNPGGYHWTNVMFHIANTLLLFLVLNRMTGRVWRSSFVAVLFAVHPLHVESVAWISERKDVLSAFFWMLTLWAYVLYAERPSFKRYVWVLVFFVLGLLSKPMVVTLPFVLLLLDYWPLKRLESFHAYESHLSLSLPVFINKRLSPSTLLILEKVPLLILSLVVSILTFINTKDLGGVATLGAVPFYLRVDNSIISYVDYIIKMFLPHNMAVFYPYPDAFPLWQVALSLVLLLGMTFLVLFHARRLPYLAVGWFWYLGTLVPVIGLVQAGIQAMADRYTYVSFIGLFVMVTWGVADYLKSVKYRKVILTVISSVAASILMLLAWQQVQHWKNTLTLFTHTLRVTELNYLAYDIIGQEHLNNNKLAEAIKCFRTAVGFMPSYGNANNNLGYALSLQGLYKEAIPYYKAALRVLPRESVIHLNIGNALYCIRDYNQSAVHYQIAASLKPDDPAIKVTLGVIMIHLGKPDKAIARFREALRLKPDDANAHYYLGIALKQTGLPKEVKGHINKAE